MVGALGGFIFLFGRDFFLFLSCRGGSELVVPRHPTSTSTAGKSTSTAGKTGWRRSTQQSGPAAWTTDAQDRGRRMQLGSRWTGPAGPAGARGGGDLEDFHCGLVADRQLRPESGWAWMGAGCLLGCDLCSSGKKRHEQPNSAHCDVEGWRRAGPVWRAEYRVFFSLV